MAAVRIRACRPSRVGKSSARRYDLSLAMILRASRSQGDKPAEDETEGQVLDHERAHPAISAMFVIWSPLSKMPAAIGRPIQVLTAKTIAP